MEFTKLFIVTYAKRSCEVRREKKRGKERETKEKKREGRYPVLPSFCLGVRVHRCPCAYSEVWTHEWSAYYPAQAGRGRGVSSLVGSGEETKQRGSFNLLFIYNFILVFMTL